MLGPSQNQNERKEGNQCLPEMRKNESDFLDNLPIYSQSGIKLWMRNREPEYFCFNSLPCYFQTQFSRCGSGQMFCYSCSHKAQTPAPGCIWLHKVCSSIVGIKSEDLPGHPAMAIRLGLQTLITLRRVGASLIMQLPAYSVRAVSLLQRLNSPIFCSRMQ